jgi:hypothetical protein
MIFLRGEDGLDDRRGAHDDHYDRDCVQYNCENVQERVLKLIEKILQLNFQHLLEKLKSKFGNEKICGKF